MVTETGKPTRRFHVVLTYDTWKRLIAYITGKYSSGRALSITVERAVREFLDSQDA